MTSLLEVKDLEVAFKTQGGEVQAVRGVSFYVKKGETLAIVGESGCGKSVTAQAILGMIPKPYGKIKTGSITFKDDELIGISKKRLQKLRGSELGMIFQDPMTSLNPTMKIGKQIDEVLIKKLGISKREAREKTIEILQLVGIPDAKTRYSDYPHKFSGGMRQRVVIAIAIACRPELIIADEPTTALDVTIQAQILDLLKQLQDKQGASIILITHDLGVVAEVADRVAVMYAGLVIETGTVYEIFESPKHPYTWGLLNSVPKLENLEKERLVPIEGTPPDLFSPPIGCPFAARCPYAMEICINHMPESEKFSNNHEARCWLNDPRAITYKELVAASKGGEC
ncbi:ABC transporter ATP-binding protein [Niallia circulans]|uniref:ABC transporter ATP-binding protein n=1 Tax=Niallia circulans TaxID=1397 RepID=A0A941JI37_NIACI|nr:ABC transporter ATP-binding protein [Niallia circulans]MCB5236286.1 ABC transporter ATP-binding protein [Niallia circulans]